MNEQLNEIIHSLCKLHPGHRLMTKELLAQFQSTGRQEYIPDPVIIAKYFTPWSSWTWYATEFDLEELIFFGAVHGHEKEIGYFSLLEMLEIRGPAGLRIERDIHFGNLPLSSVHHP